MRFRPTAPRPRGESIVPMINVVFLLLVFFLMTATIAPSDPVEVTPPDAEGGAESDRQGALYLTADGRVRTGALEGAAAIAEAALLVAGEPLPLVADRETPSARVAAVLRDLAAAGISDVHLIVARP